MNKPDKPVNEPERIATLNALNILDTPPEERFDRLTRLAKRLFNVPIAIVTLVDVNRQWFKSCIGLTAHETSRDISFCGHAILGNEVFVIPDARQDNRFSDNPLVTSDPHIRFYAGCPIKAPNGQKLGTLCIIDTQPRSFTEDDILSLTDLASMVEREFCAIALATMDELTGLSNRRGFLLLAEQALTMCLREQISTTLIFLDLDNFKPINDTYGHAEGDKALITFGQTLKSCFRESDIVARVGGDEFAVMLMHQSPKEAAHALGRFKAFMDKINQKERHPFSIQFSYGRVEFDANQHQTIKDLLEQADNKMYQQKQNLKNR